MYPGRPVSEARESGGPLTVCIQRRGTRAADRVVVRRNRLKSLPWLPPGRHRLLSMRVRPEADGVAAFSVAIDEGVPLAVMGGVAGPSRGLILPLLLLRGTS